MEQREYLKIVKSAIGGDAHSPVLPEQDAKLFEEIVGNYMMSRIGSLRHKESSVKDDLTQVKDFLEYTGKPPWMWTEEDFERWCFVLGKVRKVSVPTQRKYQSAIKCFLEYVVKNVKFRNEIHRLYGVYPVQICHSENCIPHLVERELSAERPALTHAQIALLFDAFDASIKEASKFGIKDLRPLQRDKAMFFTVYAGGLRASEALGLDLSSFQPNPSFPEFGDYGYISVWGKGSKGSGPRHRMVPVTHPLLPPLLCWYVSNVRPHFLKYADANEIALFLSQRGNRLGLSAFEERFKHAMKLAGLEGMNFSPHCLRHSSVTHEMLRFSTEAVRIKHGHVYASTTQGYNHIPDEFVQKELDRSISSHLDSVMRAEKEKADE